jgi:LPS O-antigen subunit length determinant protein (WzzB/FepE family)
MNDQTPTSSIPGHQAQQVSVVAPRDPDEINLLEYVYVLVKNKWWIIGATVLGVALGLVAAYVHGPRYVAEAVIAPKESEAQKTPNFAGLGALGGMVTAQLSLGGNASLEKIEIVLNSREFSASLIDSFDLLPAIYRYMWPQTYKETWDSVQNRWRQGFTKPKRLDMGAFLHGAFVKDVINKNGTMTLTVQSKDSTFSEQLLQRYLQHLNNYIRASVEKYANENVAYLTKQLDAVADPLLREKLQGLIASEFEKAMTVSSEAFRTVDPVYRSKQFKEKRLYPLVFTVGLLFLTSLVIVLGHAFASAEKTEEDQRLLEKIRRELFRLFSA